MKKSEHNRTVIENFILHYTHQNIDEATGEARDMYNALNDYIEEDHVDGKPADKYPLEIDISVEQAKEVLENAGYYVDGLWHISDVTSKCNEKIQNDTAFQILRENVNSEYTIGEINVCIEDSLEASGYTLKEEED